MRKAIVCCLAGVLAAAALLYLYPFEIHDLYQRSTLWRAGVRRVRSGALAGYEKDACRAGGSCRCVALIHGLGDSSMTWNQIFLGPVPPGTRLFAPDLPGTNDSAAPADIFGYSIDAQARAVRAALEPVCPRWSVVGNSLGGWIAARLALDWPQGVQDLVLLDAAGLDDPSGVQFRSGLVLAYPSVDWLKDFDHRAFAHPHQGVPQRAWASSEATIRSRPAKSTFLILSTADLLDREVGRLRLPTRILWGAKDGIIPLAIGRRYHSLIRGSTFDVIDDCGHLPQQECPDAARRAIFGS